jgi:hypothetical protein
MTAIGETCPVALLAGTAALGPTAVLAVVKILAAARPAP